MKTKILLGAAWLCATSLIAADAASDVKAAAKKLSEKGNYSWKSTIESAGGSGGGGGGRSRFGGPTEGKTDAGLTQLSITRGESTVEAVLKDGKGAIKTEEGWKSLSEAAEAGGDGGGGRGNAARFTARTLQSYKTPAAEVEDLVGKAKDLKKDGDAYAGTFSAEDTKGLMSRGFRRPGGDGPEIADPKGTVKFWVKDGALSKYQYNVQGKMTFNNNDVDINRTTTVEIKEVGTTKVNVPEEAKKKLG
jgi:hypothetical protein